MNFGGVVGSIGSERAQQFPGHDGAALTRRRWRRPRPVSAEGRDQLGGDNGAVAGPAPEGRNQLIGHLGTARHVGKHLFECNGQIGEVSSFYLLSLNRPRVVRTVSIYGSIKTLRQMV